MQSGRWSGSPFLITLHCAEATLRVWGLTRPGPYSEQPAGAWALLSAGKKAAQVLKNIQTGCVECELRGAGLTSEWADELQHWDSATACVSYSNGTGAKLRQQPAAFLSPVIPSWSPVIPSASRENSEGLEHTKCFSLAESSPTAQSTST